MDIAAPLLFSLQDVHVATRQQMNCLLQLQRVLVLPNAHLELPELSHDCISDILHFIRGVRVTHIAVFVAIGSFTGQVVSFVIFLGRKFFYQGVYLVLEGI